MEQDDQAQTPPRANTINYGIQQSGGVSQVGVQAVGPKASAVSGDVHMGAGLPSARAEAADLIRALRRLLEEHRDELPDPSGTRVTAEILGEEIERPEPDSGVVGRMLARLSSSVQPVAVLSAAVAQIAEAVKAIIGALRRGRGRRQAADGLDVAGQRACPGSVRDQHGAAAPDRQRGSRLGGQFAGAFGYDQDSVAGRQVAADATVGPLGPEERVRGPGKERAARRTQRFPAQRVQTCGRISLAGDTGQGLVEWQPEERVVGLDREIPPFQQD